MFWDMGGLYFKDGVPVDIQSHARRRNTIKTIAHYARQISAIGVFDAKTVNYPAVIPDVVRNRPLWRWPHGLGSWMADRVRNEHYQKCKDSKPLVFLRIRPSTHQQTVTHSRFGQQVPGLGRIDFELLSQMAHVYAQVVALPGV